MRHYIMTSLRMAGLTLLLLGIVYPLVVLGLGQLLFRDQANGSLVRDGGTVRGSTLIAQPFTSPAYFQPRPSAGKYDGLASGGSNLGPTNVKLRDEVAANVAAVRATTPDAGQVPIDMVTTSASGLDPDIAPANALMQAPRVAAARGLPEAVVLALVQQHTTGRQLGVLGEPRVNVLQLNRALDAAYGAPRP